MKINRFIVLAAIALLVAGTMGAVSMKVFAQAETQTETCNQQDDGTEVKDTADTDSVNLQCGDQNQDGEEAESTDGQDTEPAGAPIITAESAQKAAESYLNAGTAVRVELDDENGTLIYSVEFANGTDVKVDAMTGSVIGTDVMQD